MPASRSPNRAPRSQAPGPAPRSRSYWPIIAIGLAAVLAAIIATLPASIIAHALPPGVVAEEFSGSVWHGSAGKIRVGARAAGALEWWLHAVPLLGLKVSADVHWVKVGFVIDGAVNIDRQGFAAHDIKGGGPIEDLRDLGVAAGWRGIAEVHLPRLRGDFNAPHDVVGDIKVSNLTSAQFAGGTDLGGYDLRFPDGAADPGIVSAQLTDTGGPLEVKITNHFTVQNRTLVLSGTLRERANAPPALRSQLQDLAQYRGRDPQGRIPVELELNL
jgi:Type II secretion system (T2SS), protein N